jgi:hypothetical protein
MLFSGKPTLSNLDALSAQRKKDLDSRSLSRKKKILKTLTRFMYLRHILIKTIIK